MPEKFYCGLDKDQFGGMTPIGNLIRDAWVFGILPEGETCENWTHDRLQAIHNQTQVEWDKYGCLVSNLPDELRERHSRINSDAVEIARKLGWEPEILDEG